MGMRRGHPCRPSTLLACACVMLTLAQCSSSNDARPAAPTTSLLVTYGAQPTASAKMVCGTEGQTELGAALRVQASQITTSTWVDHVYRCTHEYSSGSFSLSVKELPSISNTIDYFTSLKAKYTVAQLLALGQDGFTATDGTSIVRKDNEVLVVDVAKLPDQFGTPAQSRSNASAAIAITLLGCWTGE